MSVCTLLPFCSPDPSEEASVRANGPMGMSGAVVFDDHKPLRGAVVFEERLHHTTDVFRRYGILLTGMDYAVDENEPDLAWWEPLKDLFADGTPDLHGKWGN
jgi:hypothetical protein